MMPSNFFSTIFVRHTLIYIFHSDLDLENRRIPSTWSTRLFFSFGFCLFFFFSSNFWIEQQYLKGTLGHWMFHWHYLAFWNCSLQFCCNGQTVSIVMQWDNSGGHFNYSMQLLSDCFCFGYLFYTSSFYSSTSS